MTSPDVDDARTRYQAAMAGYRRGCAVNETDSGGRKHPESEHHYRTCFQRDRDRVVHCSAFRRLDFKTQVFVPHADDHFRTRLTHTLEVAQIGRDMGRALGLNEDLIETVALAHDLGHSPFGHGGEHALDELMADHGGFEHNRQSLRVVDFLEHPYPDFRGLNLTHVVRECLAKHETRYDSPESGEFDTDEPAPLEGQIVDLADEIAYTAADLEDALNCGWLAVEQLQDLTLWQQAWKRAGAEYPTARPIHRRIRATKIILALMADDLISHTEAAIRQADLNSLADVRHADGRVVDFSPAMRAQIDPLQQFLMSNVYTCGENLRQARDSQQLLRELFNAFLAAPQLLPSRYEQRVQAEGLHRVTCDYIAGMTDRFCKAEHARILSDPNGA